MSLTLVILAAGMGSRFGGDKQIEPVGPNGEFIIDYSVRDAALAGFDKIVFVIRRELEKTIAETALKRASKVIRCEYVFQDINDVPHWFSPPPERTRPWGTAQALLAAESEAEGSFAVINADDYYGRNAFFKLADFLSKTPDPGNYCMVGYKLKNTVTAHGTVNRGICEADNNGFVKSVTEVMGIKHEADGKISCDNKYLDPDTFVSMTCFGFSRDFFGELKAAFEGFLKSPDTDKIKGELYLPNVAGNVVSQGRATMRLLSTDDKWYGVTYKEDRDAVIKGIRESLETVSKNDV